MIFLFFGGGHKPTHFCPSSVKFLREMSQYDIDYLERDMLIAVTDWLRDSSLARYRGFCYGDKLCRDFRVGLSTMSYHGITFHHYGNKIENVLCSTNCNFTYLSVQCMQNIPKEWQTKPTIHAKRTKSIGYFLSPGRLSENHPKCVDHKNEKRFFSCTSTWYL